MTKQLLAFAMTMLFAACGGDEGPSGPPVSKPSCESRCKSKLTGCGLPSSDANQVCPQICDAGLSESEMTCLEDLPCDTEPEDAADECGIEVPND
jgi:hypothetical protein